MTELKNCLVKLGFSNVTTYIASGNVILASNKSSDEIQSQIEQTLPKIFRLDSELIKVLVLSLAQLQAVIDNRPEEFGEQPKNYRSDVIFLMSTDADRAMSVLKTRDGVDKVWTGEGVIYFQRLDSLRTKSRLSSIIGTPIYKSITIRSWGTVTKLLEIMIAISQ